MPSTTTREQYKTIRAFQNNGPETQWVMQHRLTFTTATEGA